MQRKSSTDTAIVLFVAFALTIAAAAPAARAARATPVVAASCDVADWRLAKLGRAALPAEVDEKNAILTITGGAIGSAGAKPQAALIDLAEFDVVNLAQRDLAGDPAALAATLAAAKTRFISASFTMAGAPWKSHAIIERGRKRYAVIGIATRSAASAMPANVQFVEPREALKQAIAEAGNVDGLIVLVDAPLSEAAAWQKEFPQIDAMIVSGRGGGGPAVTGLAVGGLAKVLRAPPGGQALGVLPADGAKSAFAVTLNAPATPSEAYQKLAKEFALDATPPMLAEAKPDVAAPIPTMLEANRLSPVGVEAKNRAAVVSIRSAGVFDNFAGRAAPAGKKLLVLDVQFRNTLSPHVVRDQQVPVTYLIPKLTDHLYLVADGKTVLRSTPIEDVIGMLSLGELKLPRAGSTEGGKLVYEIDATSPPRELALRMYDYAHGSFVLPVLTRPAGETAPEEKPVAPLVKNEVLEIGAFFVEKEKSDQLDGQAAPAGMMFVTVDLRARSQFTYPADATAFDPKARVGQKTQVGTVADWTDSRKYLWLVADGEHANAAQPQTTLDAAPRFLPDVMTGGRVVFLAPKDAKSLELRCDMPNAKMPEGKVIRPKGVTVALEGKRPALANINKPIARIEDDVFVVHVVKQATADTFGGAKAGAGKRFVVLDVTVNNRGKDGETFQTAEQLKVVDAAGAQSALDPATYAGAHRPAEQVFIPAGERRSFQVAYQLDATETRPRLAYAGVSKAETVELARLAPLSATPVAEAPSTVAPVAVAPSGAPSDPTTPAPAPTVAPAPAPAVAPVASAKPQAAEVEVIEVEGKKFPARVPVRPGLKAKGLAGVGLTPEQVNAAIDRGSAFLWNHVNEKDLKKRSQTFGHDREHVLVALALVHSGAHKKYPEFDAQLRKYLEKFDANALSATYQVGLYCMLVEAYGDPTYLPQLKKATRWLVENQGPEGSWGYGNRQDAAHFKDAEGAGKVLRVAGGRPMDGSDVAQPMARAGKWEKGGDGDNSVSQYALLGLHAASRSRVKSTPELWQRAMKAHTERQDERLGGWSYSTPSSPYGSMTCAGICALALTQHELGQRDVAVEGAIERGIERGLGWLSANFSVSEHPRGSPSWHYYYLYSVERVGRILDTEFVGDHEWYPQGATYLVGAQTSDGSWIGKGEEEDPRLAGSFALLFLTRATSSLAEPQRSGPGTLKTAVSIPPGRKLYIILDASGSMLEEMDGKPKFEIAREALTALIQELPPNAEVALRAYGHRKRAIEEGASEDSKLLVPMGKINKPELMKFVTGLRARGKTPLAYSLEQAVGELPQGTEESPLTVLLLTDGGEDTQPRRDPIAAAAAYAKLPNVR
ncbi:MAG: VWA domain-containing protein, partial [Tepidisphaeraceae bacterium]